MTPSAFIALGSNQGDREVHLTKALAHLEAFPKSRLLRVSRWIETDPEGEGLQGKFLNGAAEIRTQLEPEPLLQLLLAVEEQMGRPPLHPRNDPRAIDLDLIAYGDRVLRRPQLILPHPRMHERPFVLMPLAEIAPDWRHPILGRSASELLEALRTSSHADHSPVR